MARCKSFEETEVLERAVELFWCKGYNATSMQDVVDKLGISRSSLYDTFGDKHQLFIDALQHYRKQQAGALIRMVNAAEQSMPVIRMLLESSVEESLSEGQCKGCFLVNAATELATEDPQVAQIVQANTEDVVKAFETLIRKGQASGEVSNRHEPAAIARFLYNNLTGIRVLSKASTNRKQLEDIVQVALAAVEAT